MAWFNFDFCEWEYLISITLSIILGFLVGFERKHRIKEAGVRTHTIVCMGSALMMVVSKYGFKGLDADVSRIASQIVTGIGFLGAGIIVYKNHEVRGLTTAAGVWATAGIGMACGAGMYITAIASTLLLIVVQCLLHLNIFKNKRFYRLSITFENAEDNSALIKQIFSVEHFLKYFTERQGDKVFCKVSISTDTEYRSEKIAEIMKKNPFITSIERIDD